MSNQFDESNQHQKTWIFIILFSASFITSMATTVTVNMLPSIMADFHVETSLAQWLTSGATLVSGVMIPITAFLIRRIPNKKYFIAAMLIFAAGSWIGMNAPNFYILLGGRLVQAVGCGMLLSFSQIILLAIYPKSKHGTVMAAFAVSGSVSPIVAPTIAGFIIDWEGWRGVFTLLLILGALILVFGIVLMRNVSMVSEVRLDTLSVLLSSAGFCGLLIGIGNLSRGSFFRLTTGGSIMTGMIALSVFVWKQLKSSTPLLNLRVFRYPKFRISVILSILMYLLCMGNGTLLPIFSQSIRGYTATAYALATIPGSVLMAVTTLCAGKIYDKIGSKLLLILGGAGMLAGSILGLSLGADSGLLSISMVSILLSVGMGFLNTPITTMGLSDLEGGLRVDGSSIFNTLRQVSSSLASTMAVLVYTLAGQAFGQIFGMKAAYVYFSLAGIAVLVAITVYLGKYDGKKR